MERWSNANSGGTGNNWADQCDISVWDPSTASYDDTKVQDTTSVSNVQNFNSASGQMPSAVSYNTQPAVDNDNSWYSQSREIDNAANQVNYNSQYGGNNVSYYNQTYDDSKSEAHFPPRIHQNSSDKFGANPSNYNTPGYGGAYYNPQQTSYTPRSEIVIRPPNIHSNPLMDDEDDNDNDAHALVKQLKEQSLVDNKGLHVRRPNMLSESALGLLKRDLDQAGEMFKSPELLKLAREANLGLIDVSRDETVLNNDIATKAESSNLSAFARSFVPVKKNNEAAVIMIQDFVAAIVVDPGEFHVQNSEIMDYFNSQEFTKNDITKIVDIIITTSLTEENFKYLGAKFCNNLCQLKMGKDFRSELLQTLQKRYKSVLATIEPSVSDWSNAHAFIMLLAELYMHLRIKSQPITVIGKFLLQMLQKLLESNVEKNFFTVTKIIKLTGGILDDNTTTKAELDNLFKSIQGLYTSASKYDNSFLHKNKFVYDNIVELRKLNWGRRQSSSEVHSEITNQPETNDNYYMNEEIYFTNDGKMYTYADAEFSKDQGPDLLDDTFTPDDYVGPNDEELFGDPLDDEYDADFEQFLKESGQY